MEPQGRMSKKLSILVPHDIKIPAHINKDRSWGWMSEELKKAFLV